jgi:hypothetical protein
MAAMKKNESHVQGITALQLSKKKSSYSTFRQQHGLMFNYVKFHKLKSRCLIQHHIIQGHGEWRQVCSFTPWPLNKRMRRSQSRYGYFEEEKKNLVSTGN